MRPARIGTFVFIIVACLVVGGLAVLVVFEPRPPLKHFEVPVSNERFAH